MADGDLYFAWVGGPVVPAFEALVTGDTWGGSIQKLGNTWGGRVQGVVEEIENKTFLTTGVGLRNHRAYTVQMAGIEEFESTYIIDPDGTSHMDPELPAGGAAQLVNEVERSVVLLDDLIGLVAGETYEIAAPGITPGTTFLCPADLDEDNFGRLDISQPATATNYAVATISRAADRNVIKNVAGAGVASLVDGQTYDLFGLGLPTGTNGVWDADTNQFTLSAEATITAFTRTFLASIPETCPDGSPFDPVAHAVMDETIVSLQIHEAEGEFATASAVIKNPGLGLLAPGRSLWCWISYDDDGTVRPLFHGRVVAVPEDLAGETITLTLRARADNHETQKATLAATMREMPYWDPVFLAQNANDPDTLLETRPEAWHIDRLSHTVTTTNIVTGEDGTLTIGEADHLYDQFALSYGSPPAQRCNVIATISYTQTGQGDIDLTQQLWTAFKEQSETTQTILASGVQLSYPIVPTMTGDGLKSSWPAAGTELGGGWTVGDTASIQEASWIKTKQYPVRYYRKAPEALPVQDSTETGVTSWQPVVTPDSLGFVTGSVFGSAIVYDVLFDISQFRIHFPVHYAGARPRTETLSFSLEADIQSVLPGEPETIELNSDFVDQPIDPGGAMPIGDLRRNSYFITDRGESSVEFLMLLARNRLLNRARCVTIKCVLADWRDAIDLTCRWNATIADRRLPGGTATGKVTGLTLNFVAGEFSASVEIASTVGKGIAAVATGGVGVYADEGLFDPGIQQMIGGDKELVAGELVYQDLDNIAVIDDDGLDFFSPENMVFRPIVVNGLIAQKAAIDKVSTVIVQAAEDGPIASNNGDGSLTIKSDVIGFPYEFFPLTPIEALQQVPTTVELHFMPVDGASFESDFYVLTKKLAVPKQIDLAAA